MRNILVVVLMGLSVTARAQYSKVPIEATDHLVKEKSGINKRKRKRWAVILLAIFFGSPPGENPMVLRLESSSTAVLQGCLCPKRIFGPPFAPALRDGSRTRRRAVSPMSQKSFPEFLRARRRARLSASWLRTQTLPRHRTNR